MSMSTEICGASLAFDCSDPVPECPLPKGHNGPHIVDGCVKFTDEDNYTHTVWVAERTVAAILKLDPESKASVKEFLRFCNCDEQGRPLPEHLQVDGVMGDRFIKDGWFVDGKGNRMVEIT